MADILEVLKQTEWPPPNQTTFDTIQKVGENPYVYREILMAQDADGDPEPYSVRTPGGGGAATLLRIPHNLSRPGAPRIPDVVIPVPVFNLSVQGAPALIWALWPGKTPFLPLPIPPEFLSPVTGSFADDQYVYLIALGLGESGVASFVVYVEYTHSIISDEVVVGTYDAYDIAPPPPP